METIVFTGTAPSIPMLIGSERSEWKALAARKGHTVKGSVSSKTTLVVASYEAAKEGTTKWREAHARGVKIVSYEDYLMERF
jgi:NAD-dependent DNA ligase